MPSPLKADPTRTTMLRREYEKDINRRFKQLKKLLFDLLVKEDAFGLKRKYEKKPAALYSPESLTGNTRWRFQTDSRKIDEFHKWIKEQLAETLSIIPGESDTETANKWWSVYSQKAYEKGAGRAFDQVKGTKYGQEENIRAYFSGTKDEFLRQSFANPVQIERLQILASRVYTDLRGVTETMSTQISRELVEGLARGDNPSVTAKRMSERIDIGRKRALTIARTETIRAHAESQLDTFESLGMSEIKVMSEWITAGDSNVCPLCAPLEGTTYKVSEARGLIPRHPNCRCMFMPANVGENPKEQKRDKAQIDKAIDESVKEETGKKRSDKARESSKWIGADKKITKEREKEFSVTNPLGDEKVKPKPKPPVIKDTGKLDGSTRIKVDPLKKLETYKFSEKEVSNLQAVTLGRKAKKYKRDLNRYKVSKTGLEKQSIYVKEMNEVQDDMELLRLQFLEKVPKETVEEQKLLQTLAREVDQLEADLIPVKENFIKQFQAGNAEETQKIQKIYERQVEVINNKRREAKKIYISQKRRNKESIDILMDVLETNDGSKLTLSNQLGKMTKTREEIFKKSQEATDFVSKITSKEALKGIDAVGTRQKTQARASYSPGGKNINMSAKDTVEVYIHEIGHHIEASNEKIKDVTHGFVLKRSKAEQARHMNEIAGTGFDLDEVCYPDDLQKAYGDNLLKGGYGGKLYGDGNSEIISQAYEQLARDPVTFAKNDPEYFRMFIAILKGRIK